MQVIGICRFSYLGIGGFQVKHDSLEQRQTYLYDASRMEERFRTFATITLPSMRAQTDDNFTLLVVIGESLPKQYRDRLEALTENIRQVVLQSHPPGPHRKVMQHAINLVRRENKDPCLQFRMDDDDAVSVRYVETLRETAQDLRKMSRKHRHIAIDFNQGYIARPGPKGLSVAPTQSPYSTPGLALMMQPEVPLSVMNFSHHKVAQNMPTVTFTGTDMMLRGHNDFNDSRQKDGVKPVALKPLDAEGEELFRKVYNIDADAVRNAYSRNRSR